MQTVFNKKTVCPKPFWAHAFVSGLFFCSTFDLYKNLEDFCRGQFFFSMQNREHKSPHFVGDLLVTVGQTKRFKMVLFWLGASFCLQ